MDTEHTVSTVRLTTQAGIRLVGTLTMPKAMPKEQAGAPVGDVPLVVMAHGVRGSRKAYRFARFAQLFAQDGIASVCFDFSGRGESEGSFADMTVPSEVDELAQIVAFARTLKGVDASRIALLGHSQGGLDVSLYAGEHPNEVAGIVLMAAAAVIPDDCRKGVNPIPGLGQEYLRTGAELDVYGTAAAYRGPVCIIAGAQDKMVPVSYALRYAQIYENPDLHIFGDEGHPLMRRFDEVCDAIRPFLRRCLGLDAGAEQQGFLAMLRYMQAEGQPLNERVRSEAARLGVRIENEK